MAQQFTGRKLVVIGGSCGIAVIVRHRPDKVEQTVAELSATGTAGGIAADLRDLAGLVKMQASWPASTPMPPCWSTPSAFQAAPVPGAHRRSYSPGIHRPRLREQPCPLS